ncbi:unnamed protein product [Nezara viridula]|uniref:Uncharacterized protein n=1 Tax=Nezara viridula TaxID=85310 RepID=A0A9P0H150_NEZVI|nr:unnamed protein product [Nezara viridula]
METKHGEVPKNVQSIENIVVDDNEHLDESPTDEEIKDCGATVISEGSMAEIVNDSEPSGAEKEKNIYEGKETLIEKELLKEDEFRSDYINPNLPVVDETDVDISEANKGKTLTDITTNDKHSKPKDNGIYISDSEEIKADKGPYRIKQKLGAIDPGLGL